MLRQSKKWGCHWLRQRPLARCFSWSCTGRASGTHPKAKWRIWGQCALVSKLRPGLVGVGWFAESFRAQNDGLCLGGLFRQAAVAFRRRPSVAYLAAGGGDLVRRGVSFSVHSTSSNTGCVLAQKKGRARSDLIWEGGGRYEVAPRDGSDVHGTQAGGTTQLKSAPNRVIPRRLHIVCDDSASRTARWPPQGASEAPDACVLVGPWLSWAAARNFLADLDGECCLVG